MYIYIYIYSEICIDIYIYIYTYIYTCHDSARRDAGTCNALRDRAVRRDMWVQRRANAVNQVTHIAVKHVMHLAVNQVTRSSYPTKQVTAKYRCCS